jgi:hypothetical protein
VPLKFPEPVLFLRRIAEIRRRLPLTFGVGIITPVKQHCKRLPEPLHFSMEVTSLSISPSMKEKIGSYKKDNRGVT